MQNYIKPFTSASMVGMDVHKKTIASCIYHTEAGAVLDERELPHDLPRIPKYLRKVQDHHGPLRSCYEASSCGFGLLTPKLSQFNDEKNLT